MVNFDLTHPRLYEPDRRLGGWRKDTLDLPSLLVGEPNLLWVESDGDMATVRRNLNSYTIIQTHVQTSSIRHFVNSRHNVCTCVCM